ncbi:MAG: dual specificity protein phosphatase family protein, partial [Candidatus Paceibacterales bacterium]
RDIGLLASLLALMLEAAPESVWTKLGIEKLVLLEGRSHSGLVEHNLNYDYITDGIYIGTNQCCQTHFNLELLQKGIGADISLEENKMDMPFGVDFYLWLPVKDHAAPSKDQLNLGVKTLTDLINVGKKVYIHCKNGHGRAPTLFAAYLISRGMEVNDAIKLIESKRSVIHLSEPQIKALNEFKTSMSKN